MNPRRTVIYVRCSRGNSQEPETQRLALRQEADRRGWVVVAEKCDLVSGDPARRARTPKGLGEAIDFINDHRADVILIFAADRLVRSPVGLIQIVNRVRSAGGSIASLRDGADLDTTTDQGELLLFLTGWFARLELRLTRERTRAGLQRARLEGKVLGRPRSPTADLAQVRQLHADGMSQEAMSRALQLPRWTIRKALQEILHVDR